MACFHVQQFTAESHHLQLGAVLYLQHNITATVSVPLPRHRRSTLGCRAFSVAGPMAWNALPDDLRDPSLSADNFRKGLKTHLFRNALGHSAH